MADFGFARFGDDEEDDEEETEFQFRYGGRDGLIFLIDCSKKMFDPDAGDESHFQLCMKCVMTTMQNKIIGSDKDHVGVVFFGTEKSENPSDFKHIYIYQTLDQPGAERILDLEEMQEKGYKKFGTKYGHSPDYSLSEALWTCATMFSNSAKAINSKRILLFTNNDNPHVGNKQLQRQARTKAADLNETGIELELMHLQKPGEQFDITKFYKDLLFTDDDELTELADPAEKLEELLTRVRTKDHKKRALRKIPFSLGEDLNFSVGVYNLVRSCPKPSGVRLSRSTNEELKSHSKTYLVETGETCWNEKYTFCFMTPLEYDNAVTEIKRFGKSGLTLMGFKPRSKIKKHYHVRPASFIYPDENTIAGSTTLFTALLKKCLDRDVVPICKFTPNKNSPPKFVALIPQKEEIDEHNVQVTPPGFHLIFLPFADDFRKVKIEDVPRATTEQIDKAKEVVKKLAFNFSSESFENPVLQKHWRNIEALALDQDEPEEMIDYTLPNETKMAKRAGKSIDEFKDLVFPADYVPGAKKRAVPSESAAAKKAKLAESMVDIDIKAEAQAGRLGKLTVAVLKEAIKKEKIPSTGSKKADLIDAINKYFGVA
ncbi:X-ray repair cross-complementing protein 6-like [Gigantopelta aegis]|uniref:X-ray repair cross-complementing protein 6-like n=1 Tax=Gigantopelta aegis TaxID=1735272 RepID=UPI001B8877D0|nr:X-ray repair cross-complementing protein 6-like [Gigantopelta aegis]